MSDEEIGGVVGCTSRQVSCAWCAQPAGPRRMIYISCASQVPFCSDLPAEQVSAIASAVELRGLAVPGRHVLRLLCSMSTLSKRFSQSFSSLQVRLLALALAARLSCYYCCRHLEEWYAFVFLNSGFFSGESPIFLFLVERPFMTNIALLPRMNFELAPLRCSQGIVSTTRVFLGGGLCSKTLVNCLCFSLDPTCVCLNYVAQRHIQNKFQR